MTENVVSPEAPDWGINYGISSLWTEVEDGLWVGGTDDDDTVGIGRGETAFGGVRGDAYIGPKEFDSVVTLYAWAQPVDWLVEEYRWGIYDGDQDLELEDIRDVVVWAHKRWKSGKRVLIRCQAGLSRSPFITSLVLIREGYEPQEAVDLIRRKRSGYCVNLNGSRRGGTFHGILYDTPVEYWRD